MSAQWWEQLGRVRSWRDLRELFDPLTLLYYWPYGRHGINFHPPLAGQLNLAAHAVFGHWMKDIPARRMASVIEFALTITIGFHFLARRYGAWVGLVMAGSLLVHAAALRPGPPDRYRHARPLALVGDGPGVLERAARAHARRWRVAVGILLGLAFIEKMGAVMVLLPLLLWLVALGYLPRTFTRPGGRFDWIDGCVTTGAMLVPLALAFQQIQILQQRLPPPNWTDLFVHRPASDWPGAILAVPLAVWFVRRLLGSALSARTRSGESSGRRSRPGRRSWPLRRSSAGWATRPGGVKRSRGWPTTTRSAERRGALPDIQIIYFGQIYEFSLPWHNAWVLIGITVPVAILGAGVIGLFWAIGAGPPRPAAALLPDPFPDLAGDPDVPHAGARRRAALPADVLLPGGVRGLGDDLAGRLSWRGWFRLPSWFIRLALTAVGAGLGRVCASCGSIRTSFRITTS